MRPFELSLIICLVLFTLVRITAAPKLLKRILFAATLIALLLHLVLEGGHWQMAPAYLAALYIFLSFLKSEEQPQPGRQRAFGIVLPLLLCGMSVAFSLALPMFTLPKTTGPYMVGTCTLFLEMPSGTEVAGTKSEEKRQLVVQIWYPAEASKMPLAIYRPRAEADLLSSYESIIRTNSRKNAPVKAEGSPFPILLFNHGLGGRRTTATYLTEDLASHGYVVVSIDHPGIAARMEWSDGHVIRGTKKLKVEDPESSSAADVQAEWDKEVDLWAVDQIFVLNALQRESGDPKSVWYQRLNTNCVGALGHSFGGSAALYVSSADSRIKAGLNVDGWVFGGISNRNTDKPAMFIYGDLDSQRLDDPALRLPPKNVTEQLTQTDFGAIKRSLIQYGGYVINITDTSHLDFTDKALVTPIKQLRQRTELGPIKPTEIHTIVRSYVLAFFDKTLRGKDSPLLVPHAKSPFSEVTYQEWLPENDASRTVNAAQK